MVMNTHVVITNALWYNGWSQDHAVVTEKNAAKWKLYTVIDIVHRTHVELKHISR